MTELTYSEEDIDSVVEAKNAIIDTSIPNIRLPKKEFQQIFDKI